VLILVTQLPSVEQLGGSMLLRSQVTSGNVVVFRTADSFTGRMAFNGALPVDRQSCRGPGRTARPRPVSGSRCRTRTDR